MAHPAHVKFARGELFSNTPCDFRNPRRLPGSPKFAEHSSMRIITRITCTLIACLLPAFAEDPAPAPETLNLVFVVPPDQIIKEEVHEQGGRDIIVREIEPIELPDPDQPVQPQGPVDPSVRQQFLERMASRPQVIYINGGATVYRSNGSPVRSLVKIYGGDGQPLEFWSSADFGLLAGIPEFTGNDGKQLRLFLLWSPVDLDRMEAAAIRFGKTFQRPQIPELPAGYATFILKSGNPNAATMANIQALHDAYNAKHGELVAAAEARKVEQAQREAELLAHPPVPKDIIIHHWQIDGSAKDGGAR